MFITDVFLAETGLSVTAITITTDLIGIAASTNHSSGTCPACGRPSDRVHSHYTRTIADRPWRDRRVVLRVTLRRFRCANPDCPQAIFCERIDPLAPAHARSTGSLMECHRTIGFTACGEEGSRLAEQLAMPTSPDTILRRIKSTREEPDTHPRFVGVDDWAWKKGHNYGTILIDLERGRVIDIRDCRSSPIQAKPSRTNNSKLSGGSKLRVPPGEQDDPIWMQLHARTIGALGENTIHQSP